MEAFLHFFGLCGESHPTIWHALGGLGGGFIFGYQYIKLKLINIKNKIFYGRNKKSNKS